MKQAVQYFVCLPGLSVPELSWSPHLPQENFFDTLSTFR